MENRPGRRASGKIAVSIPLLLVAALLLLCFSAAFSASETALFSLTRFDVREFAGSARRAEVLTARLLDAPRSLLVTILLGNMLVNVTYFWVSSLVLARLSAGGAHPALEVAVGLATLSLVIVCGEVAPKSLALRSPRFLAPLAAPILAILVMATLPLRVVLEPVVRVFSPRPRRTEEDRDAPDPGDLEMLVSLGSSEGVLDREEQDLILQILELSQIRARDIMIPRVDLSALDSGEPLERFRAHAREHGLSEVLVCEPDLDHVIGVVKTRSLFVEGASGVLDILRPVVFVPETASLENVLSQLRSRGSTLAVVLDEHFATDGVVTLEHVIEEIVGDVTVDDEVELQEEIIPVAPGVFDIPGGLSLLEWNERFHRPMRSAYFETVGGFVLSELGRLPREGDAVEHEGARIEVTSVARRRIARLRVTFPAPPDREGGAPR